MDWYEGPWRFNMSSEYVGTWRVLDWMAALYYISKANGKSVYAGLSEDWDYTCGVIYENGRLVRDERVFIVARESTPCVAIGSRNSERIPCWRTTHDRLTTGAPDWWNNDITK